MKCFLSEEGWEKIFVCSKTQNGCWYDNRVGSLGVTQWDPPLEISSYNLDVSCMDTSK